ncbi:MAG: hypothetical protein MRY21_07185 [Simkaniaceae bacterium]|nr:hypothetical protein [Simkaniaceae bacterium]
MKPSIFAYKSLALLPRALLWPLARTLGRLAYYLIPKFRKRAHSNLALASELNLSNKEIKRLARASMESLAISMLEYGKLERTLNYIRCRNPDEAQELIKEGKGVIFFCAHQANWEVLFLDGCRRMEGAAIGRPIKNKALYEWITQVRERMGGKMLIPKNAIKEGLRALKQGKFLGIVGDQGMPESTFCSKFLGRSAYTSTIPALLSYRTGAPLIFAETVRKNDHYRITYSPPVFPRKDAPMEEEVERLMKKMLGKLEKSIKRHPEQWMWQHNRWKQETPANVFYAYRYDSILLILDDNSPSEIAITLREIYPRAFITALVPEGVVIEGFETLFYKNPKELYLNDYRFKCIFNYTCHHLKRHYKRLSAEKVLNRRSLERLATKRRGAISDLSEGQVLRWAITREPNAT